MTQTAPNAAFGLSPIAATAPAQCHPKVAVAATADVRQGQHGAPLGGLGQSMSPHEGQGGPEARTAVCERPLVTVPHQVGLRMPCVAQPGVTHDLSNPMSEVSRGAKRTLDIVVALATLVITSPIVLAALLAVRLGSRGSLFYSQYRVGQGGRPFRMYKIRSMRPGDDAAQRAYVAALIRGDAPPPENGVFKLVQDPRITAVGRFLRRFSIDEIPQLWNVLRGEMSLVGPRPALPYEVALYDDRARQRLRAKPGMTGLWQVSGRCKLSFSQMVELDIRYLEGWRVWSDLIILARTPTAAIFGRGAA